MFNNIAAALEAAIAAAVAKIKSEPVVLIDVAKAIFVLFAAFGLVVTTAHQDAIETFLGALILIFGGGALAQRAMVTPNSKVPPPQ